ncbi:hypothetical protein [Phaeodactylibacter sp.]|jgi:hypothetical protein|uniref:hypothetical protein n=1 Tax=Phaeodactylibacter sp. TaxID=1940289 RepID=UPI0025D414C5|nr:hypothetical protein [Phaeodactylibacter sp.]MCI4647465.1 hypothetical protein [Phaeodactylibacter sp.]MCI5094643.1 hypothetical protein [Phaeodactylibacter sp.]
MQRITICFCLIAFFALTNCDRENFIDVTEIPEEVTPVEVEVQQGFALKAQEEDIFVSEGSAMRFIGADGVFFYAISSGTITCEGGGAYSTSYTGPNLFFVDFYEFEGEHFVTQAGITTEVDGQPTVLFSLVAPGSGCQEQNVEVTITEITATEISGTFTGDFFKMDGPIGSDLPCSGFVYVDEYTASFSLPYEDCE